MIVAISPGSHELHGQLSGRCAVFRRAGISRDGLSVSKYAVGFYEQHSIGKNDEGEGKNTFAIMEAPDSHTGYTVMVPAISCNIFSVALYCALVFTETLA